MIINKQAINSIFVNLQTSFLNAFSAAPTLWQKIAMKVESTSAANDYSWLQNFPQMREWIGEKHLKMLAASSYILQNKDYEATIQVKRNDIEDDNLGMYATQAKSAGDSAAVLPDKLVFEVLNGGFTSICYDKQYFFDTDHPVTGADGVTRSVSNTFDKPLSVASNAAAAASFGAAQTQMMLLTDDYGEPLNVSPNIILVGPALKDIAKTLMTAESLEIGKPNIYKGNCEVVVSARIKSPTAWFLLDTTRPVKPFIYQERKKPVMANQTSPESDDVYDRGIFKFGVEARANAGYGFWQMAFGSTGTGVI